tara:strand:+ start:27 stop:314 length:288 start_codon:yes stop_codon:yes gene_type:complete
MKIKKPTKKDLEKEHELYLARLGYTPKRLRKGDKIYQPPKPAYRSGSGVPCSNTICAIKYSPKRSGLQQYTVAPAYNKGAYQLITKNNIKDIGRS